jgi:site-specific recombinase XerD
LQDLQRSFLRHLRAEGRSPATLRLYGQAVTFFARCLESTGRTATLDELTRSAIREWLATLSDDHEPGTVNVHYRGLHRFCWWLVDEDELDSNPMSTLSPPELRMKPVPVLSDAELAALLKACAGKEFNDRRDEALIRLLLDCGVRISEACGLHVDQLDLDQGLAIVTGKGSKVRPCTSAPAPPVRSTVTCVFGLRIGGRTSTRCSSPSDEHPVYYDNCSEVRAAGKDPIRRGDPGYGPHLHGDGDGIGCETGR